MLILKNLLAEETKWYDNNYYKVLKPIMAYQHDGWEETNSYYGSSRISKAKYKSVKLNKGDELHSLVGGLFLVKKDQGYFGVIEKSKKDPFERSYGNETELLYHSLEALVKDGTLEKLTKQTAKKAHYNPV
jgi:hypothetical protein